MPNELRKLQTETFVLNLREPIARAPQLPGFDPHLRDDHTLEIEVSKSQNLNEIFAALTAPASKCCRCAARSIGSRSCSSAWSESRTPSRGRHAWSRTPERLGSYRESAGRRTTVFSLGGFIGAIFAKSHDQISWFPTFVLTPLTNFGGVFYSIQMLPEWARALPYANPILYMVNGFRYGSLGVSDVDVGLAYAIMLGAVAIMFALAVVLLNRGTGIGD